MSALTTTFACYLLGYFGGALVALCHDRLTRPRKETRP